MFTRVLRDHGVHISMVGNGRWVDNAFIERLWRGGKYADFYLPACEAPAEPPAGLTPHFAFYNTRRRHSAMDRRTPDAAYVHPVAGELVA